MSKIARLSTVVAIAATLGLGATPALASTSPNGFGQMVVMCANHMLPVDIVTASGGATIDGTHYPDGYVVMFMPGSTTPMVFTSFGEMVTEMRSGMCS